MKLGQVLAGIRVALCVCVFASGALVVDYQNPGDPAFCAVESSCFKVRTSDVGQEIARRLGEIAPGLLLPHLAMFIFLGVLAFTFFVKDKLQVNFLAGINTTGAVFAVFLIYAQAKMKLFCAYCMAVDISMLVAAGISIALALMARKLPDAEPGKHEGALDASMARANGQRATIAFGMLGALMTVLPFIWARFPVNPPLPPQLAELQQPGKTVVVTFTDFQCPHCRSLHTATKDLFHQPDVVVHRFMVPLPGHTGAIPAALTYMCAPEAKREEIADALYNGTKEQLTYEGVLNLLAEHGVEDLDPVVSCMGSATTQAKIQADKELFFEDLGGQGIPTTYVGSTMIKGANPERVASAFTRAGTGVELPTWAMFAVAGVGLVLALWFTEVRGERAAPVRIPPPPVREQRKAPVDKERDDDDDRDDDDARKDDDDARKDDDDDDGRKDGDAPAEDSAAEAPAVPAEELADEPAAAKNPKTVKKRSSS